MHICFISEGYPVDRDPIMTFLRELVVCLSKEGIHCSVVSPQSITRAVIHKLPIRPLKWVDTDNESYAIDVYQPYYFSFSNYSKKMNQFLFSFACRRGIRRIKRSVDCVYGHFWQMGVIAAKVTKGIPVFVASGESVIYVNDAYSMDEIVKLKDRLAGVIYVSTKNYNESVELGLQEDAPYIIAPNGFAKEKFFYQEKNKCREKLNWEIEDVIIGFVGKFCDLKGINRLLDAVDQLNKEQINVKLCCVGSGDIVIDSPNVLFSGVLPHDKICDYLCSCDMFVLPTLNEGCCNAIIEALACGLPIISSDKEFNYDVLDETCSILINPIDIQEIKESIKTLVINQKIRSEMSSAALEKAKSLSISVRAKKISEFISRHL